ncbi:MAG TPA: hypothetical protein VGF91_03875 [Solirubrobacteraceae bacterium]
MNPQIKLDFSSTNADGLVYTRASLASEPTAVGMDLLGIDGDGNMCVVRVVEIKGQTVYLRPDWNSWQDGPVTAVKAMVGRYQDLDAVVPDANGDAEPSSANGTNLIRELAPA